MLLQQQLPLDYLCYNLATRLIDKFKHEKVFRKNCQIFQIAELVKYIIQELDEFLEEVEK